MSVQGNIFTVERGSWKSVVVRGSRKNASLMIIGCPNELNESYKYHVFHLISSNRLITNKTNLLLSTNAMLSSSLPWQARICRLLSLPGYGQCRSSLPTPVLLQAKSHVDGSWKETSLHHDVVFRFLSQSLQCPPTNLNKKRKILHAATILIPIYKKKF